MNRAGPKTERFSFDCFSIKLAAKTIFVTLGIISLLNACASKPTVTPHRIPDLSYSEAGQSSYLWTAGGPAGGVRSFSFPDYATVTRIDGVDIPGDYVPMQGSPPYQTWLLEIPAGQHVVEIMYKEGIVICHYGCWWYSGESRQTLTFTAEPNQTYTPSAIDEFSCEWFWIEDWGPYVAGSETRRRIRDHYRAGLNLRKPVVAGKAPSMNSCESYFPPNGNSFDFLSDPES